MFSELLVKAKMNKRQLATALGICANTVYDWGNEAPKYAIAYLEMVVLTNELKRCLRVNAQDFKDLLSED